LNVQIKAFIQFLSNHNVNYCSSSTFSGMALVFYFLTFWFCKSSYEEESKTEEDKPKETDAVNEELLCAESVL